MVLILLLLMFCAKFHEVTMEYNDGAGALVMFIDPVFTCNDGTRIRGRQLCDGKKDCSQYEDEYSCSYQGIVEAGTFFPGTGGYLKAFDQFRVGKDLEINLDIKPRNISGVLLGVHAKKLFLVLQMINGAVKLTVNSGNGPFYTIFKPQTSDYFCDNRWHSIKALKSKSLVLLTVDGNVAEFGTEPDGVKVTNTYNPLYVGGYPPDLSNARGIETKVQYFGCMRNLQINGQNYDFSSFTTFGSVRHHVCPTI